MKKFIAPSPRKRKYSAFTPSGIRNGAVTFIMVFPASTGMLAASVANSGVSLTSILPRHTPLTAHRMAFAPRIWKYLNPHTLPSRMLAIYCTAAGSPSRPLWVKYGCSFLLKRLS